MSIYNLTLLKYVTLGVVGVMTQYGLIFFFRKVKAFQPIYKLSPESHHKKSGTPSLGGIGMVITFFLGWIFFLRLSAEMTWLAGLYLSFSLIGFSDDIRALLKKQNKGFSASQKFIIQSVVACGFLWMYSHVISPLSVGVFLLYLFGDL